LPSIGSKINYEYLLGRQKLFHRRKNLIFWVGIVILGYLSLDKNKSKFFTHFWKYFFGLAGIDFSWTDFFAFKRIFKAFRPKIPLGKWNI
jgi:hypothetical protein